MRLTVTIKFNFLSFFEIVRLCIIKFDVPTGFSQHMTQNLDELHSINTTLLKDGSQWFYYCFKTRTSALFCLYSTSY